MIENTVDFELMIKELGDSDMFLHVIPIDISAHFSNNSISLIFLKNLKTFKTYGISINHPDSIVDLETTSYFLKYIKNSKNKKWILDKKSTIQLLTCYNMYDINLCSFLTFDKIIDFNDYTTQAHNFIIKNWNNRKNLNRVIPLVKHLEVFEELADDVYSIIKLNSIDGAYEKINNIIIPTLAMVEKNGIYVDDNFFIKNKNYPVTGSNIVYSSYNLHTSTGRPSNAFGGVNFAALNRTDGTRKSFKSRYGKDGKLVMIDYTAFHPRIICYLTKYNIPIDTDIYEYLAKLYFQKSNVTQIDIKNSKNITFRQLFGGIEEKYRHIKYFSNLKKFIDCQWEFFQINGFVLTPIFKRKITKLHIKDPNPYKLFNYILQAVEGEIAISKLKHVIGFLIGKKTIPILYTYDSFLIDYYIPDGNGVIDEIYKIMSFDNIFPLKTYIGDSYETLQLKY